MPSERVFTPSFTFLLGGAFAFFTSMWLVTTLMPNYIVELGGSEADVGLVLGVFAFTALLARPIVGRLVDQLGRKIVAIAGLAIYAIAPLLYMFASSIPTILLARMFNGLGIAFFSTAGTTWVADMVPARRRAEAMGVYGSASQIALAVAPLLGAVIYGATGFTSVFLAATAVAALGMLLVNSAQEKRPAPGDRIKSDGFREAMGHRDVLTLAFSLMTTAATWGILISFLPIVTVQRQAGQSAHFFAIYAVVAVILRVLIGQASDRLGRKIVAAPALLLLAITMMLFATLSSSAMLYVLAILYSLSFGAIFPTLSAFLVDVVPSQMRGAAVGVFTAGFDLGVAVGSYGGGVIAEAMGMSATFVASGVLCLAGLVVLIVGTREPQRAG